MVADALDGLGDPKRIDGCRNCVRIFHHVDNQLAQDNDEFMVDCGILAQGALA